MTDRKTGTVKWFSNKRGYGFIAPSDNPEDDVFVHQSVVTSSGYRSLFEGWVVEFEIALDENGKKKAEKVTGVGGGPCVGPRPARKPRKGDAPAAPEKTAEPKPAKEPKTGEPKPPREPRAKKEQAPKKKPAAPKKKAARWHEDLSAEVTAALDAKSVSRSNGTIDLSVGGARIKLGNRSYAAIASAEGYVAEGTFEVNNADGLVSLTWERAMQWKAAAWTMYPSDGILTTLDLKADSIKAVNDNETPVELWGPDKGDPKAALEANGFMMRRVVLSNKQVTRAGRNGGAKKGVE